MEKSIELNWLTDILMKLIIKVFFIITLILVLIFFIIINGDFILKKIYNILLIVEDRVFNYFEWKKKY